VGDVRLTPRAKRNLQAIWRHIAEDNPKAADRLITRIFDKLERVGTHPGIGGPRPELSKDARLLIEGNYLVIYEPKPNFVLVVAVVHGARDLREIL
jgi:toxin ParE1/3/4